jgi:hypothetical protein
MGGVEWAAARQEEWFRFGPPLNQDLTVKSYPNSTRKRCRVKAGFFSAG